MYITLEQLILIATFIVALVDCIINHENKKKYPPSYQLAVISLTI